jgi:hypothetical protein
VANNIITNGIAVRKALPILRNKLPMVMMANKDYQAQVTDENARAGGTIFIKRPPRYLGRDGELMQVENTVETAQQMTLQISGVDVSFSQKDLQLSADAVKEGALDDTLDAAMTAIAAKIESAGTLLYRTVPNVVGTPGTPPTDPTLIATANAFIDSLGGTIGSERYAVLDSFANASLAANLRLVFNPEDEISRAFLKGRMGNAYGFEFFTDPAIRSHTAGVYGGTPAVNGAGQTGTTVVTNGWTAGSILNVGDVIRIAGVNAVNPQTRQSTGQLYTGVVTATATADGSGNMTIQVFPAITPSGQFQSVTNSPAGGALITVLSGTTGQTSRQSLLYDKNAFTFASVPLANPGPSAEYSTSKDRMSGISLSVIRQYDIKTNQVQTRFDVLYSWFASYPELAVRLQG